MKNERGTDLPVKLAAPTRRALAQAGITRLDQLAKLSEAELGKLHGIGPNAVRLLAAALKEHGFSFRAQGAGGREMRFMMLMIPKGYEAAKPGTMPDAKAVEAMMRYNESLQKAGVLLALDGLHPVSMGARVSFKGGKPKVTDGPFPEAKEVVGGYWMIQVKSKEEAIEWAKRCPAGDNEVIEIRQVQEMSEFPDEIQQQGKKAGL